jgi:hypothetical protein
MLARCNANAGNWAANHNDDFLLHHQHVASRLGSFWLPLTSAINPDSEVPSWDRMRIGGAGIQVTCPRCQLMTRNTMARGSLRAELLCWPELVTCPQARFFLVAEIALRSDAENRLQHCGIIGFRGAAYPRRDAKVQASSVGAARPCDPIRSEWNVGRHKSPQGRPGISVCAASDISGLLQRLGLSFFTSQQFFR